jgi:hypothetical protein
MKTNMWKLLSAPFMDDGRRLKQKSTVNIHVTFLCAITHNSVYYGRKCHPFSIESITGTGVWWPSQLFRIPTRIIPRPTTTHLSTWPHLSPHSPIPPGCNPALYSIVTNISFLFGPFACSTGYLENNVWSIRQYSQCLGISF